MATPDLSDIKQRMDSTIEVLKREFSGLRTGRASVNLLDTVMVEAYGGLTPLNQVGSVGVGEARLLTVSVWDKTLIKAAEKAIRDSGLGLNPQSDGNIIRIPIPALTEERRIELIKVAGKYTEGARVAVRNVRRDGMDMLKKMEKDGDIAEDDLKKWGDEVQKITDSHIKIIDDLFVAKEKEIKQV